VIVTETYGPEDQSTTAEKSKNKKDIVSRGRKKTSQGSLEEKKRSQREYEEPTVEVDY
jgi:hypothetical protein